MVTVSQKEFQRVQLSERQVQRLKRRYRPDSVAWVHHGNRGRPMPWALPAAQRGMILELARGKYVGFNDCHHAEAGTAQAPGAVLARTALLRGSQLGSTQDAAHALAADRQMLFAVKFLTEMTIVEPNVLAARQFENHPALGGGKSPGHGASPIAVMHPGHGVRAITPLEPLHLPFTQLHPLELFLTHCHHPSRVTKSGCS